MTPQILYQGQYFGELLRHEDHAWGACSLGVYGADEAIAAHYHVNDYISLLVKGAYVEQGRGVECSIAVGQVIYRPAAYTHANHFRDAGGVCFNIEFNTEWMRERTGRLAGDLPQGRPRLPEKVHAYPAGTFVAIYKLFRCFRERSATAGGGLLESDCTEHFIHLYDELTAAAPCSGRLTWVKKVQAILENEMDESHTIEGLASRVFVHPIYMARAFRERTELTVGEYQLRCRLRKAAGLLAGTTMPGVEIAYRTGFYDAAHFSHAFKIGYGFTPGQFRALYKS